MDEESDILREQANGHRIYGASKAPRYLACTGSLRAEFGLPDTARYEAAEGTVAHDICDQWLKAGSAPVHRLGETVTMTLATGAYHIPVDEEMFTHCQQYVEWCQSVPGDHFFEQYVDYSELTPIPDQGGTCDHFVCRPRHLTVTDFKYGVADQIYAMSEQPRLYAIGVILKWDWLYAFDRVTIRICQPRLNHFDVWETTVDELMTWAAEMKPRMYEAWDENAPRTPGEKQCRYCKAKLTCEPASRLMDRAIDQVFGDEREPELLPAVWTERPPAKIAFNPNWQVQTTPALVHLLEHRKLFEKIMKEAQDELTSRVMAGEKVPGWGIYDGKNSRRVANRDGVLTMLRGLGLSPTVAYETDFLSPAKLETLLIKKGISRASAERMLAPFVQTIPGNPVVAMSKPGKREALNIADEVFQDETDSEL